jgi:hypothetical protein
MAKEKATKKATQKLSEKRTADAIHGVWFNEKKYYATDEQLAFINEHPDQSGLNAAAKHKQICETFGV